MQKLRKASLLLLICSTVAFVAFVVFDFLRQDKTPPVITIPQEPCVMSVADPKEKMLEGVTAKDNRSGDVTASVVVEKVSSFLEDGSRIITYAAIDGSGNVGRGERTLLYTDYQAPWFELSGPVRIAVNEMADEILGNVHAVSPLDGDLTDKVKYHLITDNFIKGEGSYQIELKVEDSAGMVTTLPTWLEVYDPKSEGIKIELSTYLAYLTVGAEFDAGSYVKEVSVEGDLSVDTNVDTQVPGVYYADYTVNGGNTVGTTRLIVVVQ